MRRRRWIGLRAGGRARRASVAFVVFAAATSLVPIDSRPVAAALPAGFTNTVVWGTGQGLVNPSSMAFAPNGEVFVGEQDGRIWSFTSTADATPTLAADLRPVVYTPGDHAIEDIVVDPEYPATPYLYVHYSLDAAPGTTPPYYNDTCPNLDEPGCPVQGRVSRLRIVDGVMSGAEQVLLQAGCYHGPYHGPASLAFGTDGYLYASSGEGARNGLDYGAGGNPANPCGDPPGGLGQALTLPHAEGGSLRSQDLRTPGDPLGFNGSIVRIDKATGAPAPGNPMAGAADEMAQRMIAHGFRNPWRMAFRPGTDELWIGDVGALQREELNRIADVNDATVENFGWPCYEGTPRHAAWDNADATMCENLYAAGPSAVTSPHFEWRHDSATVPGDGCPTGAGAITGLAFYESGPYPDLYDGSLFFIDLTRNCLYRMAPGAGGVPDPATTELFASNLVNMADLEVSPAGELYYLSLFGCNCIRRLRYTAGNAEPVAVADANVRFGALPLNVQFDGSASSDPEAQPLSFAWDLDGDGQYDDATGATPSRSYPSAATITIGLRVTDVGGAIATDSFVLRPGEQPPNVTLVLPTATTFAVGDEIAFAATATDGQDGALAGSAFTWAIVQYHCNPSDITQCHEHQFQQYEGVSGGSFTATDHELPSHLEVRISATDSAGLQTTVARRLDPRTHTIALRSSPPGVSLTLNTRSGATPLDVDVIEASTPTATAPLTTQLAGVDYEWVGWSDGGAASHVLPPVSGARTLTATYRAVPIATPQLAAVNEPPGTGTAVVSVPVSLSFATDRVVTIPWETLGYTATSGSDFSGASGAVTIPIGQTQGFAHVTVRGDTLDENDELLLVSFKPATNAKLGGFFGIGFGLIVDDDPLPVLLPTTGTAVEGDAGTTTINVPVYLDRPSGRTVSAGWVTLPWSASQGSDFVPAWGQVVFAPGQTMATIPVTVNADAMPEGDELFFVWLVEPKHSIVGGFSGIGIAQITDDD